jgi:hypothetical protein
MNAWYRASTTLFDRNQKIGTITVYFDYDLRCWLFGVSMDPDPCWYDFRLSLGPVGVSFTYWRRPVFFLQQTPGA